MQMRKCVFLPKIVDLQLEFEFNMKLLLEYFHISMNICILLVKHKFKLNRLYRSKRCQNVELCVVNAFWMSYISTEGEKHIIIFIILELDRFGVLFIFFFQYLPCTHIFSRHFTNWQCIEKNLHANMISLYIFTVHFFAIVAIVAIVKIEKSIQTTREIVKCKWILMNLKRGNGFNRQ